MVRRLMIANEEVGELKSFLMIKEIFAIRFFFFFELDLGKNFPRVTFERALISSLCDYVLLLSSTLQSVIFDCEIRLDATQ